MSSDYVVAELPQLNTFPVVQFFTDPVFRFVQYFVSSHNVFSHLYYKLIKVEEQNVGLASRFEGRSNTRSPARSSSPLTGRPLNCQQRWVPPSIQLRDVKVNKNEITFRKIRSILNKLTPEKFDKLCQDILNIGINSKVILKGVVILIYEKAIDELRYSSLYANLCRRLYHEAPNFDPPQQIASSPLKPNTFRRLLIAKLQDEFENRNKKLEAFDSKDGPLTVDEEEQRNKAKHHMLGNIKFIGELYRLDILQESIVHKCIKQLIQKKKKGTVDDLAEDLECLCQIMTTCGRRLDHEKAKSLMDQYFDRLNHLHKKKTELPSRVRFMLQDVMELRMQNWAQRGVKINLNQGPKTLGQIRSDLAVDYPGLLVDSKSRSVQGMMGRSKQFDNSNQYFPSASGLGFFPLTKKQQFNGLTGPLSPPLPVANDGEPSNSGPGFDFFSPIPQLDRPAAQPVTNGGFPKASPITPAFTHTNGMEGSHIIYPSPFPQPHYSTTYNGYCQSPQMYHAPITNSQYSRRQQSRPEHAPAEGLTKNDKQKEVSQHFARHTPSPPSGGEAGVPLVKTGKSCYPPKSQNEPTKPSLSMTSQTTLYKSGATSVPSMSPRRQHGHFRGAASPVQSQSKPPPPATADTFQPPFQHVLDNAKKSSSRKLPASVSDRQRGRKSYSEKEAMEISKKLVADFTDGTSTLDDVISRVNDSNLTSKHMASLSGLFLEKSLFGAEKSRAMTCRLLSGLCKCNNPMTQQQIIEGLQFVFEKLTCLETELPRVTSITASLLARIVISDLLTLKAIGERLIGGYHFPLFLLTLQQMIKLKDRQWTADNFNASGLAIKDMMPEVSRANKDMLEILNGKQLGFLLPLLKMEAELSSQLDANPSPSVVYRWIKDNVNANLHTDPSFINILMTCVLDFITKNCSLAAGCDRTQSASKQIQEEENKLLSGVKPLLQKFIHDSFSLQLHALYAVQVFCHGANFPKGLMLRLFNLLYHEDVIDEETFILWKEDFNDKYPGKGKSLFQVNSWLTWLQEADTEDDEEEA